MRTIVASALCLSAVALLSTKTLFNIPVGIMSVLGLIHLLRAPARMCRDEALSRTGVLFLCIWLPMIASLPDAVNVAHSAKTTSLYLHFYLAAVYLAIEMRDEGVRNTVFFGIAGLMIFCCVDALLQYFTGSDVFGYPYDGQILKGLFYPKQRLGIILAVFSPLYFEAVRQLSQRNRFVWLLMIPLIVVLMLTLKRSAWVMFALASFVYAWWLVARQSRQRRQVTALRLMILLVVMAVTTAYSPNLQRHVERSLGLFSTDFATADNATSYRLSLWRTGGRMFRANWLNGIGPRGFRHVYVDYAQPDDFWIQRGTQGQTHPHFVALEVAVETGVIGLVGYLLFWLVVFSWLRKVRWLGEQTPAWIIAAGVAWFPLSAHFAFYGSYWSSVAWLLLAAAIAADSANSDEMRTATNKSVAA